MKAYIRALPAVAGLMIKSLNEMSAKFGVRDGLGVTENLNKLADASERNAAAALALHNKVLHQSDALQTMAVKSKGDLADVLFTVRLQQDVYRTETLASSQRFGELLKHTEEFINAYPLKGGDGDTYARFVQSLAPSFEITVGMLGVGAVRARQAELMQSLSRTSEEVQKAHLNFLNAVLVTLAHR
jgi:hypothetical protein